MGIAPLFCCFRSQQPNCMALTGLAASIVAFAFMIWGLADLWFDRKGVEAIYIIAFILVCISLVAFIIIFIFLNLRKTESYRTINNVGRIFCLVILIMCFVAFIFLLVAFIILIVDYADVEKEIPGQFFPSHEWAAVFVPSILGLICLVIMALAANILYKVFYDYVMATPYPVHITQNSMTTTPNPPQPVIFPVTNGPAYPTPNNVPYPVTIQQSGVIMNK
jgi:hypothetical protein